MTGNTYGMDQECGFHVLVEGKDYYVDGAGHMVFTEEYHLKRGRCCGCKCRHCPWRRRSKVGSMEHT